MNSVENQDGSEDETGAENMTLEDYKLEQALQDMRPQRLDDDLTERLLAAVGHPVKIEEIPANLLGVEKQLQKLQVPPLDYEFRQQLVGIVEDTPFHKDERMVYFPGKSVQKQPQKKQNKWLAAAAAVAIFGAGAAFWISPTNHQQQGQAQHFTTLPQSNSPASSQAAANEIGSVNQNFAPVGYTSRVQDAHNMGVKWNRNARPMRVLKITLSDQVEFKNEKGEILRKDIPRTEYLVIPARVE